MKKYKDLPKKFKEKARITYTYRQTRIVNPNRLRHELTASETGPSPLTCYEVDQLLAGPDGNYYEFAVNAFKEAQARDPKDSQGQLFRDLQSNAVTSLNTIQPYLKIFVVDIQENPAGPKDIITLGLVVLCKDGYYDLTVCLK